MSVDIDGGGQYTELLLVRHGKSTWNAEGRLQGQADPPLSSVGEQQARAVSSVLSRRPIAAVYCSPLLRARATANAIAAVHGLDPHLDHRLSEINLGAWQAHRVAELRSDTAVQYRKWLADPRAIKPPHGETLDEALARAAPAVQEMVANHAGHTIVLVTHSIIGRAILSDLLGVGTRLWAHLSLKQGLVSTVRFREGVAVLERLNAKAKP